MEDCPLTQDLLIRHRLDQPRSDWTFSMPGNRIFTRKDVLEMKTESIQELIQEMEELSIKNCDLFGHNVLMQTYLRNILLERRVVDLEQKMDDIMKHFSNDQKMVNQI